MVAGDFRDPLWGRGIVSGVGKDSWRLFLVESSLVYPGYDGSWQQSVEALIRSPGSGPPRIGANMIAARAGSGVFELEL